FRVVDCLYPGRWEGNQNWRYLEGLERHKTPLSEHLVRIFRAWSRSFTPLTPNFEDVFERFEILAALAYIEKYSDQEIKDTVDGGHLLWMPVGRTGWNCLTQDRLLQELKEPETKRALLSGGFGRKSEDLIDR